jgi:Plasmid pRiA4b ORF-3-like protein
MNEPSSIIEVYQLHVWLCEISPLIWRRLLVRSDSTIADLHHTLQIAMGWGDAHLHRFRIRGKDYGISCIGGIGFRDDPRQVHLADFHFRPNERFLYEYDFGDLWQHVVRVERRLPWDRKRIYPVCIGGQRAAPPEDCGGPWAFMALQDEYSPRYFLDRYADLLESVRTGDLDEARDQLAELEPLQAWLELEHVDRRQMNRRLKLYALGDEAWRWE